MHFSGEECSLEKHEYEGSEKLSRSVGRMGTNAVVNINVSMRGLPNGISRRDLLAILSKVGLESGATVTIEKTEGQDHETESLSAASLAVGGDNAMKRYLFGVKENDEVESSDDDFEPVQVDECRERSDANNLQLRLARRAWVMGQGAASEYPRSIPDEQVHEEESDAFSIIDSEAGEDPINGEHYIDSDYVDSGPITDASDNEEDFLPEDSLQEMRERWNIPPPPNGNNHIETDSEDDYHDCSSDDDGGALSQRTVLNQMRR